MKVLSVLLGPGAAALAVVQATMDALQEMSGDSPWLTLFDRQSKTGKSARFQVATAQLEPGGLLQTALVAFDLRAKADFTQVLFFKFKSSSTTLQYAAGRATIYDDALKSQRDVIARRLEEYRAAYVAEVKLPAPPGATAVARGRTKAARPASAPADTVRALLAPAVGSGMTRRGRRR